MRIAGRYQIAASVIGVVLAAIIGYFVWSTEHHDPGSPSAHQDAVTSTRSWKQPVKVEQVTPLTTGPNASFVIPENLQLTPAELSKLNQAQLRDPSYLANFQTAHGWVPLGVGSASVTLMGNAPATVTITGLRVVKECGAPLAGTFFYNPAAGESDTISLGFNLDSPTTYAENTVAGNDYTGNFFQQHVVTLAPGETHTLVIFATTADHYCHFTFQMTVATQHGAVVEKISDGGKAFQLTGMAGTSNPDSAATNFSRYRAVYVGGVADGDNDDKWMQVNPATYNGLGNPASFPPPRR